MADEGVGTTTTTGAAADAGLGAGTGVLSISDAALAVVLDTRSQEPDAASLALWVEVAGVAEGSFTYDIYFQAAVDAGPEDVRADQGGLAVVVPAASLERLRGARLDWSDDGEGGLVILNPNSPPKPAAVPASDLSDPLSQRVLEVLEVQINPSIAAHGGRADLVAVDAGTAYLRLSGGCQGCGLASVTLSQGIEVALREEIPELVGVVDVTDHASGSNPYFESAKK